MRRERCRVIVRGMRALSDFEYEFQMALMNRELAPEIETIFIVTDAQYSYLSSSAVKEVFQFEAQSREWYSRVYRRLGKGFQKISCDDGLLADFLSS